MESIFEKRLTVTPDYCDASGALSPLAAFTIFQGIAAQHAEVLGVGSSAMAKKGEFWLTVHTRVDLFERAYLMDKLKSTFQVFAPTLPSTFMSFLSWNSFTAFTLLVPNRPSVVSSWYQVQVSRRPLSQVCTSATSGPVEPRWMRE